MVCTSNHKGGAGDLAAETEPTLQVVVIYEDFAAGKRAMQVYNRLLQQFEHEYKFKINLWCFDILRTPNLLIMAAAEAAEADVVFVSAHAEGTLSDEVKSWVRRWLARKRNSSATLVALLEGANQQAIEASATRAYLRHVAEKARISFFSYGSARPKKRRGSPVVTILENCHGSCFTEAGCQLWPVPQRA